MSVENAENANGGETVSMKTGFVVMKGNGRPWKTGRLAAFQGSLLLCGKMATATKSHVAHFDLRPRHWDFEIEFFADARASGWCFV